MKKIENERKFMSNKGGLFGPAVGGAETDFRAITADWPKSRRESLGKRFCDTVRNP
jgi:hypothetical protein